ncbi:polyisoprenoid-binding protein [Oceanidesulfovibrio indonesiensis]|uniref:Polyisoprenoid-binding protein n=1 Tax=Oceanidesulfovibrio indonesiensis TaxID=54767 RepID=A0A7M3MJP6_9BACT|nr:YceI family protein [Oceanidesulfovibrio indonesiensis]TVM19788.1 polyisoprenoid-binding protein [Oceanidesulfovibrio indonesiensis]
MRTVTSILAALMLTLAIPATSMAKVWEFDMAHSNVYFSIKHIFSTARGYFADFSGTIDLDPEDITSGSIEMTVKTESVDTRITKRDNHLRSDDFFSAARYPEMTFVSSSIRHEEGDTYMVSGTLTIKDVSRDVEVPMIFHGVKKHPALDKQVLGIDFDFTVDRMEYGVGTGKFLEMGLVGKDVDVLVTLEMTD